MSNPAQLPDLSPRRFLRFPTRPRYLQLETTLACNAACEFCYQKEVERGPMRMEEAVWRKIIDETRGLGVCYRPFLQNEPLCDNRLEDICAYIKRDPTASVELNTNGELLTPERGERLLEIGVELVRFSIDGFSQQVYDATRTGVDRDRVYANAQRFCEAAQGTGCRTEVRMIELQANQEERGQYQQHWEPIADEVQLVPLYNWPWTGQTPADVVHRPCLKVLDEMFFYTDGRAALCCWDVHGRGVIGDVRLEHVLEIWNGPIVGNYRELLAEGRREAIHLCSRCDAYGGLPWP